MRQRKQKENQEEQFRKKRGGNKLQGKKQGKSQRGEKGAKEKEEFYL